MTHLLTATKPPEQSTHLIVKKAIQKGDTVIFQWADADNKPYEDSVSVTNVQTEPGMMKGWCVISWESNGVTDLRKQLAESHKMIQSLRDDLADALKL